MNLRGRFQLLLILLGIGSVSYLIPWSGASRTLDAAKRRSPGLVVGEDLEIRGLVFRFARDRGVIDEITADRAAVLRTRAVGPFRFGFLRSLEARQVEIVLREDALREGRPDAIPEELTRAISRRPSQMIGAVDLLDVRILLADGNSGRRRLLAAARCTASRIGLICRNGELEQLRSPLGFRRVVVVSGGGLELLQEEGAGMSMDLRMIAHPADGREELSLQ